MSCSDDLSVRVWRRELSETEREKRRNHAANGEIRQPKLPSIIRPPSNYEKWILEAQLPEVHVRSVYAVDWSRRTGLVLSCGGDGVVCVYQEIPLFSPSSASVMEGKEDGGDGNGVGVGVGDDVVMNNTPESLDPPPHPPQDPSGNESDQRENGPDGNGKGEAQTPRSKWVVIAQTEAAHDEYEINHVCWAPRRDAGRRHEAEEVIVSTGDDGDVRIWILPENVLSDVLGMV